MKKKMLAVPIIITCFLFGVFEMKSDVHAKEQNSESEVSISITGTLGASQTDEQNVDDKNTGENISENVSTIIKDKSIQELPSTGEEKEIIFLLIGLSVIILFMTIKRIGVDKFK